MAGRHRLAGGLLLGHRPGHAQLGAGRAAAKAGLGNLISLAHGGVSQWIGRITYHQTQQYAMGRRA